jgi:hypothetical protein
MSIYPKLIYTCEGDGIWILGPGSNPPAEIRNSKGERLTPPGLTMASIAGHTDLRDWDEVTDEPVRPSTTIEQALSGPMAGLVHELYFKKPHYRLEKSQLTRDIHDRLVSRLQKPGWLSADSDPISALFAEIYEDAIGEPAATGKHVIDTWERAESTINARIRAVCCLLGPRLLSTAIAKAVPDWAPIPALSLTSMKVYFPGKRVDSRFGQPDLLLAGERALILLEMKVRGGSAQAKYTADQFLKYLRLANEARQRHSSEVRTLHILTAPDDGGTVISSARRWLKEPPSIGKNLQIDIGGLLAALPSKRQAQVMERGGADWLAELESQMPCRFIDLRALVNVMGRLGPLVPSVSHELDRQLTAVTTFGLPSR